MYEGYRRTRALGDDDQDRLRKLEKKDALFDDVKLEWFRERIPDGL